MYGYEERSGREPYGAAPRYLTLNVGENVGPSAARPKILILDQITVSKFWIPPSFSDLPSDQAASSDRPVGGEDDDEAGVGELGRKQIHLTGGVGAHATHGSEPIHGA